MMRATIEPVPRHEHRKPGRVAAPNLEAVERAQRDLDRRVGLERRQRGIAAGQVVDGARRAQPVAPDRPQRILRPHQRGVQRLDVVDRSGGEDRLHLGVDPREGAREVGGPVLERGEGQAVAEQGAEPGDAGERAVHRLEDGRDLRRRGNRIGRGRDRIETGDRLGQTGVEGAEIRSVPSRPATQDGDDSAHGSSGGDGDKASYRTRLEARPTIGPAAITVASACGHRFVGHL